jgi:cyclase
MLRKRIIPLVLLDGFSVLKTRKFQTGRNLGSPITVARTYNTRNVDELILLDIYASRQNRSIDAFTIKDIAAELFMPLTVGGGIRTVEDMRLALKMGADKVSINTEAISNPDLITECSSVFGSQCIVASVDVQCINGSYAIYNNGKVIEGLELVTWCRQLEALGAGELLINAVDLDGTEQGADILLARTVADAVRIPVIYAGGVCSTEDAASVAKTKVSGVGISSIFHFTSITPSECKAAMNAHGVPVRV